MIALSATISRTLTKNETYLRQTIGSSPDIMYRQFAIPALGGSDALIVYINNLVDPLEIDGSILAPLMGRKRLPRPWFSLFHAPGKSIALLRKYGIFTKQACESSDWTELCDALMQGSTCLFVDGCGSAAIIYTRKIESRSITEPTSENEVRGPRDGFIEKIDTNVSLIRTRIKDYGLRFEKREIGQRTKTNVSLVYIESLANPSVLSELRQRLDRINVDSILASAYIEEYIEDAPYSVFPQIEHTERPDKACAAILDGRIVIMVDNSPFVLIVPTIFWNFIQTSGDYYDRYYFATFFRWIRLIALLMSFTLSSLYVLLASYHQEMLPTLLAMKIAEGRAGVPFPALIEAFIMDMLLEIIKEAGLRMPNPVGPTVSIVGTFIMGQAAILAGIASPTLIIFITISAICSYAIPSYSLNTALRLVRFPLLLLSGLFGIIGFFGGFLVLALHFLSLRSFGEPFFAPVIPFDKEGMKDTLVRAPWWKMAKRPRFAHPQESVRQTGNLKPKPPKGGK